MQDLRLAFRLLARQPLTSAMAMVALAMGIGLTTTMFSILNGAVLRGLPFERADRLLHVAPFDTVSNDDDEAPQWVYASWRSTQRSFEDLSGFYVANANVVGPDGTPERYRAAWITPNTFGLLRARPALGRDFAAADGVAGAAPAVIISDRVWRDRFAARPDALGQTLRVNGQAATVVAVMPPGFAFPITQDLWLALAVQPVRQTPDTAQTLEVIGRLRDGRTRAEATAEFAALHRALLADQPAVQQVTTVEIKPYVEEFIGSSTVRLLSTMFAAVLLVLVIACVNVTNLILARAADRTRDLAVRTALGARRGEVVRQTLVEVGVLALGGAIGGALIAWAGTSMFMRGIADTNPPFWIDIRVDRPALVFVGGMALLATLVAGLVPAWRTSAADVSPLLGDEGRGTTSLRIGKLSRGLVAAEIALSFALLVVSAFTIQSVRNINVFDPGITTRDVFSARISLPASDYANDAASWRFIEQVRERLESLPGVTAAAVSTGVPPDLPREAVAVDGETYARERDYPRARLAVVTPEYFAVVGIAARRGRTFGRTDTADSPAVALVSESFERAHYPQGALGRRVRVVDGDRIAWREVVGVVPDVHSIDLGPTGSDGVYVPLAQAPSRFVAVLLRAAGDPLTLTAAVRRTVADLDPNLPIYNVNTLQQVLEANTWGWRVFGTLFSVFGAAALFLAVVGLYGVMAFTVAKRTGEIGVRIALGAEPGDVMRLVLAQGAWQIGGGVLVGLGLAVALGKAMQSFFFGVGLEDPRFYAAVALVLLVTGLSAAFVPARRAARVDPSEALRAT
ncbi:MAG: ABC transporter permease [Vicinamibacterales bacterium]